MNTKDDKLEIPPSEVFISESGILYDVREIISSFNSHHYLYDFKNVITSSHSRPFTEHDICFLIQNYPKLKTVVDEHYNSHLLIGLIYKQQSKEELFKVMAEINSVLTDLIEEYDWAWIPDEVLALKLSSPLDKFYTLSINNNLKFLDFIINQDAYLKTFIQSGMKDYLSKIHKGGCSAGFVEAFSKLYAQALTCKCYVDIHSPNQNLLHQNVSESRNGFFPNSDNNRTTKTNSTEPENNVKKRV